MKRRLFLFPIEPLEERYSAQWLSWFTEAARHRFDYWPMLGQRLTQKIETGEFLDAFDTNYWKATQLASFVSLARAAKLRADDIVLFLDGWSPTVEQVAYIRDAIRVPFRMVGLLHAGTWDPYDFLTRNGFTRWARDAERSWLEAFDAVAVATKFHQLLINETFPRVGRVHVTGFPLLAQEWQSHALPWDQRQKLVVFPHRLAPEKDPDMWDEIAVKYRELHPSSYVRFVETKKVCRTKADYYALLGSARVAVSCARQETWGIAMLEAASLGCWPVAPARLSYPETLKGEPLYTSVHDAVEMIHVRLNSPVAYPYDGTRWETAIDRIFDLAEAE